MESLPSLRTVAASLRSAETTPSDWLNRCIANIDRFESAVRAWVFLDREGAMADAVRAKRELRTGLDRGPLHGIPIGIKDIIDLADMPTSCGSRRWAGSIARKDAACVRRLRAAGAIIIGKTVTTPYAYTDPPITRNPWNAERSPGGSSSGSAAAVASGMCFAALGTQTGGSLTRPASYCGVSSFKPSHGRVSVEGVLPLAPSLDHVGVIAGSVEDLRIVASVLSNDSISNDFPLSPSAMYRPQFSWQQANAEVKTVLERAVGEAEAIDILGLDTAAMHHLAMMAKEAHGVHAERLARFPDDYPPSIRTLIERGAAVSDVEYASGLEFAAGLKARCLELLRPGIAFATPATIDLAPSPETTGSPAANVVWSLLGLPTISIPVNSPAEGNGVSVQLVGHPDRVAELFGIAAWFEARIKPAANP